MSDQGAIGQLDPLLRNGLTGWAQPGANVLVSIDGDEPITLAAQRTRRSALRPIADERCGFVLPLPDAFDDGAQRSVRVVTTDGRDLPGSPMVFQRGGAEGRVDRLVGDDLHGWARRADGAPCLVVAVMGDEVVATAIAHPRNDGRFRLVLPEVRQMGGDRLVHVGVAGSDVMLAGSPVTRPAALQRPRLRVLARPTTLAIKISAPNLKVAHEWGDWHFARQLAAALQRRGWVARVDCHDAWDAEGDDAVLVLKGRQTYEPKTSAVNMMWMISHPDRTSTSELNGYDHVFVASDAYATVLRSRVRTPVEAMHQATDPSVFHPPMAPQPTPAPVLFVGNSRRENRAMVRWCVEAGIDVAVYGAMWDGVIPAPMIHSAHIDNTDLHRFYGGCDILLNDHWDTMRDSGFLSNRLFDGSAAGAFIITDPVRGLSQVFGDTIVVADGPETLKARVDHFLSHPEEARERAAAARDIVLKSHTFDHRAERFIQVYENLARRTPGRRTA